MVMFQGLVGFMPTFATVAAMAALAGLGSAVFHLQREFRANMSVGAQKTGSVAMFMLGGNLSYAVDLLLEALVMNRFGAQCTWALLLIGLAIVPFLNALTGKAQQQANFGNSADRKTVLNALFTTIAIVMLSPVMSLGAWSWVF